MIPDTQMNMQISFFFILYVCLCFVAQKKKKMKNIFISVSKNLPMIINLGWPTTSIPEIIISAMISRRRICSTSSFILAKIPTIWVPHTQKKTQIPFPHTTFVHDDDNKNSIKNQQSVSVNFFFFFGYN